MPRTSAAQPQESDSGNVLDWKISPIRKSRKRSKTKPASTELAGEDVTNTKKDDKGLGDITLVDTSGTKVKPARRKMASTPKLSEPKSTRPRRPVTKSTRKKSIEDDKLTTVSNELVKNPEKEKLSTRLKISKTGESFTCEIDKGMDPSECKKRPQRAKASPKHSTDLPTSNRRTSPRRKYVPNAVTKTESLPPSQNNDSLNPQRTRRKPNKTQPQGPGTSSKVKSKRNQNKSVPSTCPVLLEDSHKNTTVNVNGLPPVIGLTTKRKSLKKSKSGSVKNQRKAQNLNPAGQTLGEVARAIKNSNLDNRNYVCAKMIDTDFLEQFVSEFDDFDKNFPDICISSIENLPDKVKVSLTCDLTKLDKEAMGIELPLIFESPVKKKIDRKRFKHSLVEQDLHMLLADMMTKVEQKLQSSNLLSVDPDKPVQISVSSNDPNHRSVSVGQTLRRFYPERKRKYDQISSSKNENLDCEEPPKKKQKLDNQVCQSSEKSPYSDELEVNKTSEQTNSEHVLGNISEVQSLTEEIFSGNEQTGFGISFSTPDHSLESSEEYSKDVKIAERDLPVVEQCSDCKETDTPQSVDIGHMDERLHSDKPVRKLSRSKKKAKGTGVSKTSISKMTHSSGDKNQVSSGQQIEAIVESSNSETDQVYILSPVAKCKPDIWSELIAKSQLTQIDQESVSSLLCDPDVSCKVPEDGSDIKHSVQYSDYSPMTSPDAHQDNLTLLHSPGDLSAQNTLQNHFSEQSPVDLNAQDNNQCQSSQHSPTDLSVAQNTETQFSDDSLTYFDHTNQNQLFQHSMADFNVPKAIHQFSGIDFDVCVKVARLPLIEEFMIGDLVLCRKGTTDKGYWKVISLKQNQTNTCKDLTQPSIESNQLDEISSEFNSPNMYSPSMFFSPGYEVKSDAKSQPIGDISDSVEEGTDDLCINKSSEFKHDHTKETLNKDNDESAHLKTNQKSVCTKVTPRKSNPVLNSPQSESFSSTDHSQMDKKKTKLKRWKMKKKSPVKENTLTEFELAISRPNSESKTKRKPCRRSRRKSSDESEESRKSYKASSVKKDQTMPTDVEKLSKFIGPVKSKIAQNILRKRAEEEEIKKRPETFDVEEPVSFLEILQSSSSKPKDIPPIETSLQNNYGSIVDIFNVDNNLPPSSPLHTCLSEHDSVDSQDRLIIEETAENCIQKDEIKKDDMPEKVVIKKDMPEEITKDDVPEIKEEETKPLKDSISKDMLLKEFDDLVCEMNFNPSYEDESDGDEDSEDDSHVAASSTDFSFDSASTSQPKIVFGAPLAYQSQLFGCVDSSPTTEKLEAPKSDLNHTEEFLEEPEDNFTNETPDVIKPVHQERSETYSETHPEAHDIEEYDSNLGDSPMEESMTDPQCITIDKAECTKGSLSDCDSLTLNDTMETMDEITLDEVDVSAVINSDTKDENDFTEALQYDSKSEEGEIHSDIETKCPKTKDLPIWPTVLEKEEHFDVYCKKQSVLKNVQAKSSPRTTALQMSSSASPKKRRRPWRKSREPTKESESEDDDDDDDAVSICAPSEASFLLDRDILTSPESKSVAENSIADPVNCHSPESPKYTTVSEFKIPLKKTCKGLLETPPPACRVNSLSTGYRNGEILNQPPVLRNRFCCREFFSVDQLVPNKFCHRFLRKGDCLAANCRLLHKCVEKENGLKLASEVLDKFCRVKNLENAMKVFKSILLIGRPPSELIYKLLEVCCIKAAVENAMEILTDVCTHHYLNKEFNNRVISLFCNYYPLFKEHLKKLVSATILINIPICYEPGMNLLRVYSDDKDWTDFWRLIDYCKGEFPVTTELQTKALQAVINHPDKWLPLAKNYLESRQVEHLSKISQDILKSLEEKCRNRGYKTCSVVLSQITSVMDPRRKMTHRPPPVLPTSVPVINTIEEDTRIKTYMSDILACSISRQWENLGNVFIKQCTERADFSNPLLLKAYVDCLTKQENPEDISNSYNNFVRASLEKANRDRSRSILDEKFLARIGLDLIGMFYVQAQWTVAYSLVFTLHDTGLEDHMLDTKDYGDRDGSIMAVNICLQSQEISYALQIINKCIDRKIGNFLSPTLKEEELKFCLKLLKELLEESCESNQLISYMPIFVDRILTNFTVLRNETHKENTGYLICHLITRLFSINIRVAAAIFVKASQLGVPLDPFVSRALLINCCKNDNLMRDVYRLCKLSKVYPPQNPEQAHRCLTLEELLSRVEMKLMIEDYLCETRHILRNKLALHGALADEDYELNIVILSLLKRPPKLDFLSNMIPASFEESQEILLHVLEDIGLKPTVINPRIICISPSSLKAYMISQGLPVNFSIPPPTAILVPPPPVPPVHIPLERRPVPPADPWPPVSAPAEFERPRGRREHAPRSRGRFSRGFRGRW